MRVATVDGLVTLFYDGSKELYNPAFEREYDEAEENIFDYLSSEDDEFNDPQQWPNLSDECKEYLKEKHSWRQIIVMEGVTVIPEYTFYRCSITRVIFADTVVRIETGAFYDVGLLYHIKLPINLEYIGEEAFFESRFQSVFIPPSCREIGFSAFLRSSSLLIFHLPDHTALAWNAMCQTELMQRYAFRRIHDESPSVEDWIRTINVGNECELHRVCCSFQPNIQDILEIVERQGIRAFQEENKIGVTPSKYLQENPYTDISEKDLMTRYILNMMGE